MDTIPVVTGATVIEVRMPGGRSVFHRASDAHLIGRRGYLIVKGDDPGVYAPGQWVSTSPTELADATD